MQVGDWEHSVDLISMLKASQLHLAYITACFAAALCKLAHLNLQPLLAQLFPRGVRHATLHDPQVQ